MKDGLSAARSLSYSYRHDAWGRGGSLNSLYIALNLTWSPALQCRQGSSSLGKFHPTRRTRSRPATTERRPRPCPAAPRAPSSGPTAKTPLAFRSCSCCSGPPRCSCPNQCSTAAPGQLERGAPPRPSAPGCSPRTRSRGCPGRALASGQRASPGPGPPLRRGVGGGPRKACRRGAPWGCWSAGRGRATRRPCPRAGGVPSRGGPCGAASCRRGVPSDPSGGAWGGAWEIQRPTRGADAGSAPGPSPPPSAATPAAPNARSAASSSSASVAPAGG
mmetsp:Transcript_1321/g.4589  ORF Transcript_1321/g.4589 Transcript_1321/m.4589 type:complete len:275 (-) Transcript_1321:967-1791(-)